MAGFVDLEMVYYSKVTLADEFSGPVTSESLADLGIDEVEPKICAETYENRKVLRKVGWMWEPVIDGDGMPTGLIRVFNTEDLRERRLSVWDRKKPLLVDDRNPWSDYLDPLALPADADIPNWVRGSIRNWVTDDANGTPLDKRRGLPARCEMVRTDGTRCWNWAYAKDGITRCAPHLKWNSGVEANRVALARLKLVQAAPAAVDTLEHLMENAEVESVRLNASKEILDRAGIRGGYEVTQEVEVSITDPAAVVRARLDRLADSVKVAAELESKRHGAEVEDAVVVEDESTEVEK